MMSSRVDHVVRGVRQGMVSHVDDQRMRAADGLAGIADMVAQLGDEFRGPLSNLTRTASAQLRSTADRIRENDAAALAHSLAQFAQQRPLLFIGGAFVLGLGVARLLNAGDEQ
jgi:hypothetical protein